MKAYITKYALTNGIFKTDGEINENYPSMFSLPGTHHSFFNEGKEWHRTLEGAVARAEEMRVKKIASLKKQIAKLEKMTFDKVKPLG
jgi:hypothetical protein